MSNYCMFSIFLPSCTPNSWDVTLDLQIHELSVAAVLFRMGFLQSHVSDMANIDL